jgi:tartrate dehydratase alpha subunit/fumarate hydratase class I-like protein
MAKKTAKTRNVRQRVTNVEAEAAHVEASLRRMDRQQKRIVTLARHVKRAVRTADAARLDAARALCADTGFAVFLIDEVGATQRKVYEQQDMLDALRKRIEELEAAPAPAAPMEFADAAAG